MGIATAVGAVNDAIATMAANQANATANATALVGTGIEALLLAKQAPTQSLIANLATGVASDSAAVVDAPMRAAAADSAATFGLPRPENVSVAKISAANPLPPYLTALPAYFAAAPAADSAAGDSADGPLLSGPGVLASGALLGSGSGTIAETLLDRLTGKKPPAGNTTGEKSAPPPAAQLAPAVQQLSAPAESPGAVVGGVLGGAAFAAVAAGGATWVVMRRRRRNHLKQRAKFSDDGAPKPPLGAAFTAAAPGAGLTLPWMNHLRLLNAPGTLATPKACRHSSPPGPVSSYAESSRAGDAANAGAGEGTGSGNAGEGVEEEPGTPGSVITYASDEDSRYEWMRRRP